MKIDPRTSLTSGLLSMANSRVVSLDTYLAATDYIDVDHPEIVLTSKIITRDLDSDLEKAVHIHDFVRDQIRFGFSRRFYDEKASEVLRSCKGYSMTKTTLLVALLRAAGIPARPHFINLRAELMRGVIDLGTPYVDHSFAEVLLERRWHRIDSHVVDKRLADRARARLKAAGESIGYGVHVNGVSDWQGERSAYVQSHNDGSVSYLITQDYGHHTDVGQFYEDSQSCNRLSVIDRLLFAAAVRRANARIERLRAGTDEASPRDQAS